MDSVIGAAGLTNVSELRLARPTGATVLDCAEVGGTAAVGAVAADVLGAGILGADTFGAGAAGAA